VHACIKPDARIDAVGDLGCHFVGAFTRRHNDDLLPGGIASNGCWRLQHVAPHICTRTAEHHLDSLRLALPSRVSSLPDGCVRRNAGAGGNGDSRSACWSMHVWPQTFYQNSIQRSARDASASGTDGLQCCIPPARSDDADTLNCSSRSIMHPKMHRHRRQVGESSAAGFMVAHWRERINSWRCAGRDRFAQRVENQQQMHLSMHAPYGSSITISVPGLLTPVSTALKDDPCIEIEIFLDSSSRFRSAVSMLRNLNFVCGSSCWWHIWRCRAVGGAVAILLDVVCAGFEPADYAPRSSDLRGMSRFCASRSECPSTNLLEAFVPHCREQPCGNEPYWADQSTAACLPTYRCTCTTCDITGGRSVQHTWRAANQRDRSAPDAAASPAAAPFTSTAHAQSDNAGDENDLSQSANANAYCGQCANKLACAGNSSFQAAICSHKQPLPVAAGRAAACPWQCACRASQAGSHSRGRVAARQTLLMFWCALLF